jgi:hypothetical protein
MGARKTGDEADEQTSLRRSLDDGGIDFHLRKFITALALAGYFEMLATPFMYGLNTSGTRTDPSSFW